MKQLEGKLAAIGVQLIRNDIPACTNANEPRCRVFVSGKDIFKIREHVGDVSINYA